MRAPTPTEWWYVFAVVTFFCGAVLFSIIASIWGDWALYNDLKGWLLLWLALLVAFALIAVVVHRVFDTANHKITWTKNGLTILSIFVTAVCFNFPASWKTPWAAVPLWSTVIGWLFIVLTLCSLVPIWKGEAKDAEEKIEAAKAKKRAENEAANRKATVGNRDVISKGPRGRKTR
ncbi:hypothetical protein [Arthrobacter sp. LFS091]|uniref:hypothetical protein n=2 Tax=unclassified Arthrobacter TaxID=235627 RepID=UPI003A7FD1D0